MPLPVLTLDIRDRSPSNYESFRDYMYSDLNPILDSYRVKSEKTLRRIIATHPVIYIMQTDSNIVKGPHYSPETNPELITGNIVVDNWKQYIELFDNVLVLKCSKTRMSNLGKNYKYCFYSKDELLKNNERHLDKRAREKYNIPAHKNPTVSQLLNSIINDVIPVKQTARPHMALRVNPFATRKPVNSPSFDETNVLSGLRFGQRNILRDSISYESINSPRDFSKSLSSSLSRGKTKRANSISKTESKRNTKHRKIE